MFNFSLSVCKQVMCRRSSRLMSQGFGTSKPKMKFRKVDAVSNELVKITRDIPDHTREGVSFTTKYLNEVDNPEEIQWDWLTEKLESMKLNNIPSKIIQACMRLDKPDLGLRYYDYLVEEGVKLSPVDLMFFSKLIATRKTEIKKHEQLLIKLFNDIKEFHQSSLLIRKFLMEVFVEIPYCFKNIVERGRHPTDRGGYMPVVQKALELNMPETAFEFMNDSDFCVNTKLMENYINFCIRRAKEGKFSVDLINRLINKCAKWAAPITHENLLGPLSALVSVLNKYDSYQWSVHECKINAKHVCSECGLTLLPNNITDDEFAQLKDYFFRQSFIESDVFLSSTRIELQKFLKFLKTTKPYTLVLDGLNMMYKFKSSGALPNNSSIKYFLDKGYKTLIIGRIHSKKVLAAENLLRDTEKSKAQFFFTSNMSDDDVFLLYATLHGGPNTFFVTGDFLTRYSARLDDNMKCVFLKWQLSHQYLVTPGVKLIPPRPSSALSQLTLNTDKKYIWHMAQQIGSGNKLNIACPVNWYCLTAKKK